MTNERPAVAVLLATYNGRPWLDEQLASILGQRDVDVRVLVSDDGSTDGTLERLTEIAAEDPRVELLPRVPATGSSAANFYRLICDVRPRPGELIAFADQDDRWAGDKLAAQARLLNEHDVDGVSGSVRAVRPDGSTFLIRKDYPQREFDFLTESPGPGCSFLITRRLFDLVGATLRDVPVARTAAFHDSLIYAIARGRGWRWHIDGVPMVDYRQHESNVMGANHGFAAARVRFALLRSRWHREQAIVHATTALALGEAAQALALARMLERLESERIIDRWRLAASARQMRRRPRDRAILGLLIAIGLW